MTLTGELDLDSAPRLQAQLDALRAAGARSLLLDLRGLAFMDSSGLRCLLDADVTARRDGVELTVIRGPAPIQRLFDITNTDSELRFVDP